MDSRDSKDTGAYFFITHCKTPIVSDEGLYKELKAEGFKDIDESDMDSFKILWTQRIYCVRSLGLMECATFANS